MRCDKGATFRRVITWSDSTETAINLSGYSARMQVRESFGASTTVASLTTGSGEIALGPTNGQITIELSPAETAALPVTADFGDAWAGVYDLELVSAGGEVTRLLEGAFYVTPEVTR